MIRPTDMASFKVDLAGAMTPERRRTMVTIWTRTICNTLRIPHGGYRAQDIKRELEEVVKELGLTLGEER